MRYFSLFLLLVVFTYSPANAEQWNRQPVYNYSGGATLKERKNGAVDVPYYRSQPVYRNGKAGYKAPSYVYNHERREGEGKPYYSGRAGGENRPSYDYNRGRTNPAVSPLRREKTTSPVTTNVWNENRERNRSPYRTVFPGQSGAGGVTTVCPSRLSERDRSKCVKDWVEAKDRIRRKYED